MINLHLHSVGVIGPGLADWPACRDILLGQATWTDQPLRIPPSALLPATERRRCNESSRLAIAAAEQALGRSDIRPGDIAAVFTSADGDGMITHKLCESFAMDEPEVSPTQFHNSVHNAPAGYWSIATRSHAPSTSLCGYDASFATGLLEAAAQVATDSRRVLLIAYDIPFPPPMLALWPVTHPFAVALLLAPPAAAGVSLRISVSGGAARPAWPGTVPHDFISNPAAHALLLLALLARRETGWAELPLSEANHVMAELGR